jgi:transposase
MKLAILGIDLAKSVFHLHGADARGRMLLRKRLSSAQLLPFIGNLPRCVVAMEACGGAHHWAREITQLGHTTRLISPQFVKAFVKSNKNDRNDAEAICEAAARSSMRFVPVKTLAEEEAQEVHRARAQLLKNLNALVNQMRGFLAEHGIVAAKGAGPLHRLLPQVLERPELSALFRELHRSDDSHGPGGGSRRWLGVCHRAPSECLAGPGPTPVFDGRPHGAAQHQQTGQSLSAHFAGRRGTFGAGGGGT